MLFKAPKGIDKLVLDNVFRTSSNYKARVGGQRINLKKRICAEDRDRATSCSAGKLHGNCLKTILSFPNIR